MSTTPSRSVFTITRPLQPTKQLPPTPTSVTSTKTPIKRPSDIETDKRARQRVMFTPPPSTPAQNAPIDELAFKIPAIPGRMRLMTPSSSTIAASSSPPRMSSPDLVSNADGNANALRKKKSGSTKFLSQQVIQVEMQRRTTYVFGRHRHHDDQMKTTTTLPVHVASSLHNRTAPVKTIFLPRTASHASRLHAVIEYLPETDSLRIHTLGQNGVTVRAGSTKRRLHKGENMDIERQTTIRIDFHGCTASVRLPERTAEEVEKAARLLEEKERSLRASLFDNSSSPVREPLSSLPPSSPPVDLDEDEDMSSDEDEEEQDRSSSPLSAMSDDNAEEITFEVKAEALDIPLPPTPAPQPRQEVPKPRSRAPSPIKEAKIVPPVPADIDLPALIVSTIVFSNSSKLSLPDLVKHMLESQPSFNAIASEDLWVTWVGAEVESNQMFGKVSRGGKDSSGHPLQPHYFYLPDQDPDVLRAQELGGLVRPLRTVQRAGGKAIDWRPVGSGRRRY